jgi:hypothetical protein
VPYTLRQERLRTERNAFLVFLGAMLVLAMAAAPLVVAGLSGGRITATQALRGITFAELDRNRDGYVDSSETAGLEALVGTFARADRNGDGRLDRQEFAQARAALAPERRR